MARKNLLWASTVLAAKELGITPRELLALRAKGVLKRKQHYRVKNPIAARPTYVWNIPNCEETLLPFELP